MKWIFRPLARYADFQGRSPRIEFWSFFGTFFTILIALIVSAIVVNANVSASADSDAGVSPLIGLPLVIALILALGIAVPFFAVIVRRLHDRELSGAFVLINLVPYVGWFITLVLMAMPGTHGENPYGDDPLDDSETPAQLDDIFR